LRSFKCGQYSVARVVVNLPGVLGNEFGKNIQVLFQQPVGSIFVMRTKTAVICDVGVDYGSLLS
jgi:hypothetical protein